MSIAELVIPIAIFALLLTAVCLLLRPRRPIAIEVPGVEKRSATTVASSTAASGSENVAASLSALSDQHAGAPASNQFSDCSGHSASSSSHGDTGSLSGADGAGVH